MSKLEHLFNLIENFIFKVLTSFPPFAAAYNWFKTTQIYSWYVNNFATEYWYFFDIRDDLWDIDPSEDK